MKKFTNSQNKILTEIYRRLNYFKDCNLESSLVILDIPSKIKCINVLGLVEPSGRITPRTYNWYRLTQKGRDFFKDFIREERLTEDENGALFSGSWVIDFNNFAKTPK